MISMRWVLFILVGAVVLVAVLFAWRANGPDSSSSPAPEVVSVVSLERRDLTRTITLPGDIRPFQEAPVYAKVSGYLKEIMVDSVEWVKAGQTLARLEIPEMDREYRRVESNLEMKRKIYKRLADIRNKNRDLIPLEEVEQAKTEFDMVNASRDELATLMAYATIRAPFDGVVTTRYVHQGTLIQKGTTAQTQATPIVRVMDLNRVRIIVAVPESEVAWITQETPVRITVDALPGESFTGTVTRYAMALDPETRTMPTEIEMANPNHQLYPGMYAHVTFTLESMPNRLTVPRQAVREVNGGREILMVENGAVKAVTIQTGYEDALLVEVTKGLTGTEQVIIHGHQRVRPGDPVRARKPTL